MQTQQTTLQQKQAYLRDNIQPDKYEDFYEYCQKIIGSVDINSWTMHKIQQIVNKFNVYMKQQANKNVAEQNRYTYNEYQSRSNFEPGHVGQEINIEKDQPSQISQCQSSRIVKTSAVDLLDSVLEEQNYSSVKTQQRGYPPAPVKNTQHKNANQQFNTNPNLNNRGGSSFDEFDFWTSTVSTSNVKQQNQTRAKSTSQHNKPTSTITFGSPSTPKNSYNANEEYGYNRNTLNVNAANRAKSSTQQINLKNEDFDIFTSGTRPDAQKKSSPYMKKQSLQPYQGQKSSIRLKQVKQFHETPSNSQSLPRERGQSVIQNRTTTLQSTLSNPQQPFQQQITCYKSAIRNQLADRNLNIFIDKHEIIERKFLAADYAMYNVKITPLGIQCKRNYEDFSKLKTNLAKFFPGICLPYLQQTSWLNGTNADFISSQKKMLQLFSRDLIRNKQIRNSRVMEDFLTLKDHKAIKRKFQNYEKMEPLKGLEQLCLLEGKVHVTLNTEQKAYIQNLERFLEKIGDFYSRQQKLTQTLIDQYNEVMKTFKLLMNLMQEMEKQIRDFNTKVLTNTIKHLGHAIKIVRQTYKQQFSNIKFDHEVCTKKILPFLKYERKNFLQLQKLIDIEKRMKKAYDRRSLIQKIGVGENYMSENAKLAKKSVLDESPSILVLKYQAGYFGYQVRQEGQRVFDELAVKTVIRWQTLGQSYLNKLTNSIDYWQNLIKLQRQKFNTELTY